MEILNLEGARFFEIPQPEFRITGTRFKEIAVFSTREIAELAAGGFICNQAIRNPYSHINYATGDTYEKNIWGILKRSRVDFSNTTGSHLDEYHGCPEENEASFANLVNALLDNLHVSHRMTINGATEKLDAEITRIIDFLDDNPIDLGLLGIGPGWHIGFNKQGTPFDRRVHLAQIDEETIKRDINRGQDPFEKAITLGPCDICEADNRLLVGFGEYKGKLLKRALFDPPTPDCPASVLQLSGVAENTTILIDKAAASVLV